MKPLLPSSPLSPPNKFNGSLRLPLAFPERPIPDIRGATVATAPNQVLLKPTTTTIQRRNPPPAADHHPASSDAPRRTADAPNNGTPMTSRPTDAFIASAVRRGDEAALAELLRRLRGTDLDSSHLLEALAKSPLPAATAALTTQVGALTSGARVRRLVILESLSPSEKIAFGERLIAAAQTETDSSQRELFSAYGEAIVTAVRDLSIASPFRYPPDFLVHAVHERIAPHPDRRPLVTVIAARADHNKMINYRTQHFIELKKAGFRVMLFEVGTDKEVVAALQKATSAGQKADLIMFYGHGSPTTLALGSPDPRLARSGRPTQNDPGTITSADEPLLRQASGTLKPGGSIIAISCSLGKGGRDADNIAGLLRRVFPQARKDGIYTLGGDSPGEQIWFTPAGLPGVNSPAGVLQSTRPQTSYTSET